MQALSSYNPEQHSLISPALQELEDPSRGLSASSYFSERGVFARFVWPDWPQPLTDELALRVEQFHREYPQLRPVPEGPPEWQAVFRDWRTDLESVKVIADVFSNHFPGRVRWVESQRDSRGRIGGRCEVEGLGEIALHLSWKDWTGVPVGTLSGADHDAFQAAAREVFTWASSRIRPILDTLHDKLEALYGDRFRGLYVFGSYARPDAGIQLPKDSDLDVALLLSDMTNAYDEIKRLGKITSALSSAHGLVVSVVPVREDDYLHDRTNFIRVIKEDAVAV